MASTGWLYLPQAEAKFAMLLAVFEDRIVSRRADVVWPPRSCNLTPLGYYLWGVVKDKCYLDKPETVDALKDNIREAIGEIDNVLKNWTDRISYKKVFSGPYTIYAATTYDL